MSSCSKMYSAMTACTSFLFLPNGLSLEESVGAVLEFPAWSWQRMWWSAGWDMSQITSFSEWLGSASQEILENDFKVTASLREGTAGGCVTSWMVLDCGTVDCWCPFPLGLPCKFPLPPDDWGGCCWLWMHCWNITGGQHDYKFGRRMLGKGSQSCWMVREGSNGRHLFVTLTGHCQLIQAFQSSSSATLSITNV